MAGKHNSDALSPSLRGAGGVMAVYLRLWHVKPLAALTVWLGIDPRVSRGLWSWHGRLQQHRGVSEQRSVVHSGQHSAAHGSFHCG